MLHKSLKYLKSLGFKEVSNAPLVILRIVFGSLLLYSTLRTIYKGWVQELYIAPELHFPFFDFIQPLAGEGMIWLFWVMAFNAVGIILGLLYRFNALSFFVLFTYVELIDKTYYLNHYYLVSILTFWLFVVPAHRRFSIDLLLFPKVATKKCRNWQILIFKLQLSLVYFFAGLAKVNYDWLFRAQPMASWLPGLYQIPFLGKVLHWKWLAFFFSWAGCLYDLSIWVFLWIKKTRGVAYFFVILFHFLTLVLFPRIGMFPLIMISSTIIFFSADWHEQQLARLSKVFSLKNIKRYAELPKLSLRHKRLLQLFLFLYFTIQLLLPFRYAAFPGKLFWNEYGYRFSWRVMLIEKNGFTTFIIKDPQSGRQYEVDQKNYLTAFQRQQLRSQPDMILQFARYLGDEFKAEKGYAPQVFVKSRMSLNGRRSQEFTYDTVDLYAADDFIVYSWLKPFHEHE